MSGNPGPLRVVPLAGGPSRTLAESAFNATWSLDGWVYFTTGDVGISRVPSGGGEVEIVTELSEGEFMHAFAQPLPDAQTLLFQVWQSADGSDATVWSLDLETKERRVLTAGNSPRYATSGHLLFGSPDGRLMAAPFDSDRAELTGDAVPMAEGLSVDPVRGNLMFSVSEDGTLVYRVGGGDGAGFEFIWVTRSGQATPVHPGYTFRQGDPNFGLRLSPDETRIVFNSAVDGNEDVRIKHLPDGPEERITFSEDLDIRPFWTPDGQSVTYFSGPATFADVNLWSRRADGTGERVLVLDDERLLAQGSWSPDGEWVVLRVGATAAMGIGGRDILAFRPGVDSAAMPLVASPDFVEGAPVVSANGRWLAYTSNETGRHEVFVRPFPDVESTRVRVSTDGGVAPVWAKSGQELFFMDESRGLVAAQLDPASGRVLAQETLFTLPDGYQAQADNGGNDFYDVTSDGERFLMVRRYVDAAAETEFTGFVLVQNFFEELRARVPN